MMKVINDDGVIQTKVHASFKGANIRVPCKSNGRRKKRKHLKKRVKKTKKETAINLRNTTK